MLGVLLVCSAQTGAAQGRTFGAWFDAAGARITQPQQQPRDAGLFGLGAMYTTRGLSIAGQASLTTAQDSSGAGQGDLAMQFALPRFPQLRTEATLSAVSYGLRRRSDRSGVVQVRESFDWTFAPLSLGVFTSVARGGTSRLDGPLRNAFQAVSTSGGLRAAAGVLDVSVEWQRALSDDYALAEAAGYGLARRAASYDYRDLLLAGGVRWRRIELAATRVTRHGGSATTGHGSGTYLSAGANIMSWLDIVGSTGTYLADPLRGVPQAKVSSVGVRLRHSAAARVWRDVRSPSAIPTPSEVVVAPQSPGNALVTVRIRARVGDRIGERDAERAQLATSHAEWTPMEMRRDGAWWTLAVVLPTGTHRIAVRLDDGPWRAPAGTVPVRDEFGGTAGLLIVP